MSRYNPNEQYPRRERSPRFQDRRPAYNDGASRTNQLRDQPPLGARPRDSRDFPESDTFRPRRDSRDGPISADSYQPSFRGGFARGRGRGDSPYRGGRGGRRFDGRDSFRDRSPPPPRWREDRSPERRDDRRFERRDDDRWPDRERDIDRRPLPPRLDTRNSLDSQGSAPYSAVNPERRGLIEESMSPDTARRPSLHTSMSAGPRDGRHDPYLSARADTNNARYINRTSSPATQPPPSVPDFAALPFTFSANTTKPTAESKLAPSPTTDATINTSKPILSAREQQSQSTAPPDQPSAARVGNEVAQSQPQNVSTLSQRPIEQPQVPPAQSADFIAPTGPRLARSQTSLSPHMSTTSLNASPMLGRSRTPPPTAPSGPRSRNPSVSPQMTFAAPPTGPKAERIVSARPADRFTPSMRAPDRSTSLHNRPPQWNQWRKPGLANDKIVPIKRDSAGDEKRESDTRTRPSTRDGQPQDDRMDIDRPVEQTSKSASFVGHSAQQSFFGKPDSDVEDEREMSDAQDRLSSTDDDELDPEDLTLFEAKFQRQKRELEAQLLDLSTREYRSTTPARKIGRLKRLTMDDVQRYRDREMDVDQPRSRLERSLPPATHSSESEEAADVSTPKGEDNTSVEIHEDDEDIEEKVIRRIRRPTPEVVTLPYLTKQASRPLADLDTMMVDDAELESAVAQDMQHGLREERDLETQFSELYKSWRLQCEQLDWERAEIEKQERQASLEPIVEPESAVVAPGETPNQRRPPTRFASEYDIEKVLKESEETARLEQEKADRETRKNQADMEKEAVIPDQLTEKELIRTTFVDNNRLRDPGTLTMVFAFEPAPDNFDEEEQRIFTAAYKETPKKWSEIASLLPGRQPKDCIRHYYANKWDGRFRDNRAKRNRGRGPRGGNRGGKAGIRGRGSAMADLGQGQPTATIINENGRPRRAAAPTNFGDTEAKMVAAQSPAKKVALGKDGAADEKPVKRAKKTPGEKSIRKPKTTQPLPQIAAAPSMPPDGRMIVPQARESPDRSRALEDARLLTGFAARPAVTTLPESLPIYANNNAYMTNQSVEESQKMLNPASRGSKAPASSYWSVTEQSDVARYIAHFGTDFASIAAHMGTKTQTMIKNHYMRQVNDGNRPDLQEAALAADMKRQRGENLGPPPQPTPITKRKYDAPGPAMNRPLASHGDAMDIDDPRMVRHGSPHMQARFPISSAQHESGTSHLASREPAKPFQLPQSGRMSMFSDSRQDHRPSLTQATAYRSSQIGTPTGQPAQPSRSVSEAQDPQFIQSLLAEQQRAMQLQQSYHEPERRDIYGHRPSLQHSPAASQAQIYADRKVPEVRSQTPPVQYLSNKSTPIANPRRSGDFHYDSMRFAPPHQPMVPSPPKQEEVRHYTQPAPIAPSAAEPPKRSNLASLLNDDEPKPAKRSSLDSSGVIHRGPSPAQHTAPHVPPRADHYSAVPQFSRTNTSDSHASAPILKQEAHSLPASSGVPPGIPPKQEWSSRGPHGTRTPPLNPPAFERDVRPYYSYRSSMLGQMGTPSRQGPSPPPNSILQHSRTPSITADAHAEHRSYQQHLPPTSTSQYAHPQYSQAPLSSQAPSYAPMQARHSSRDDVYRQEASHREREEREWHIRQEQEQADRQRLAQRQEQERYYSRQAPPPQQRVMPPHYAAPHEHEPQSRGVGSLSMREQSAREAELMMQEQERMRHSAVYRDQEDEARQRHDAAYLPARRTPLGGGYGAPGLPGRR